MLDNRPAWLDNGLLVRLEPERPAERAGLLSLTRDNETYEDQCAWQHERLTRANRCTCRSCTVVDRISTMAKGKASDPVGGKAQKQIKVGKWRTRKRRSFYRKVAKDQSKRREKSCE